MTLAKSKRLWRDVKWLGLRMSLHSRYSTSWRGMPSAYLPGLSWATRSTGFFETAVFGLTFVALAFDTGFFAMISPRRLHGESTRELYMDGTHFPAAARSARSSARSERTRPAGIAASPATRRGNIGTFSAPVTSHSTRRARSSTGYVSVIRRRPM